MKSLLNALESRAPTIDTDDQLEAAWHHHPGAVTINGSTANETLPSSKLGAIHIVA